MEHKIKEEIDLTEESDDENITSESRSKPTNTIKPLPEMKTDILENCTKIDGNIEQNEAVFAIEKPSATNNIRNYVKLLNKAIEEIKKGGSLKSVSSLYNIPEEVLYQKLVSRSLPKETELLSSFEENNLVRWILRSNENNRVVTKQSLMERVGKMKKVLQITPIFCRSKFGKMWYDYFLNTHSEIFELEGIILPSANCRRVFAKRLKKRTNDQSGTKRNKRNKVKQHVSKQENIDLVSLHGITEVTIILEDFRKKKNFDYIDEGNGCYKKIDRTSKNKEKSGDSEEGIIHLSDSDEDFAGFENFESESSRPIGKDISNIINSEKEAGDFKIKRTKKELKTKKFKQTLSYQTKLKNHQSAKGRLPFTCHKCMKRFATKYDCKHHMQHSHHNQKLFKCDKCTKFCKNQSDLFIHVKRHHNNTISKSNCVSDICQKEFNNKNNLQNHVTYIHLNNKTPFPCDICGKCFIKKSAMATHKLKHNEIKLLPCPCCPKSFTRKHLLEKHIDICLTNGNDKTQSRINDKGSAEHISEEIIIID